MKNSIIVLIFFSTLLSCKNQYSISKSSIQEIGPAKVILTNANGKYQILVNEMPFYIKGAGLEFGNIAAVAKHGGNSFRTWRTENGHQSGKEVLDEAYKNGLMVTMGIDVNKERHGFDYNDSIAVKVQLERIKKEVETYKNHPALLIWAIGNELNLRYTNPKVWDAVNDVSKMIHEVDPNHLTTTTLAGISQKEIDYLKERCPDLDLLSFQMYGNLEKLPKRVKEYGWEGAYVVTEWGATGHWEVPKTTWGAPIEENSTLKAANYLKRFKGGIEVDSLQCVGSYVFLWGHKQERTHTWYGMFLDDGKETESVDVMHYIWNNNTWPSNRTPQVKGFTLNGKTPYESIIVNEGETIEANVTIFDFENDTINYSWELLAESSDLKSGGDYETRPKAIEIDALKEEAGLYIFKAPIKGKYRLFVYASDGNDKAATTNIPFLVE